MIKLMFIAALILGFFLVVLFGGILCFCNRGPEYSYDLDKYEGVYYYPQSKGLDYIVLSADSSYKHIYITGHDTLASSGKWETGRQVTHGFSIPYIDFFYLHFFRWADGELSSALDSVMVSEGDTLVIDNEPFMMKAYNWDGLSVSLPIQQYRRHTIDFLRVRDMAMADSLGIKIKEEDFVPLPSNYIMDSKYFQRAWIDCN